MDISHILISVSPPGDMLNNTRPLTVTNTPSMDTLYPLIDVTSAQDLDDLQIYHLTEPTISSEGNVIVEALLGLREGSVTIESEVISSEQAKGENESERQAISSNITS